MVFFGHRQQQQHQRQQQQEAALAKMARNPYAAANASPLRKQKNRTSRRKPEELGADTEDLDALCQQEIQRYEELFATNGRFPAGGGNDNYNDDDTLQDGSIYTSTQTILGSAPTSSRSLLKPSSVRQPENSSPSVQEMKWQDNNQDEEDEEESMWGLQDPYKFSVKPVSTSLLTPQEEAAAARLTVNHKKRPAAKKSTFISNPPLPPPANEKPAVLPNKATTITTTPKLKKQTKKKSFFASIFHKSSDHKATTTTTNSKPPTSSTQKTTSKTPKTQASTPASSATFSNKKKFFSSPARLFPKKKASKDTPKKQHPNLLLASYNAAAAASNTSKKQSPPLTNKRFSKNSNGNNGNSPAFIFPPSFPSPSVPPPVDNLDVCSVVSAQSSLTDALDVWMISNSPPTIIGGDHLPPPNTTARFDAYEGGLSPYHQTTNNNNDDDDEDDDDEEEDEDYSIASPAANRRLTEADLYYHNSHTTNQEEEEEGMSSATVITEEELNTDVIGILLGNEEAVSHDSNSNSNKDSSSGSNVKRILFDTSSGKEIDDKFDSEDALEPETWVDASNEEEEEQPPTTTSATTDEKPFQKVKSPRFKKFLPKFARGKQSHKQDKISHEERLEQDRARIQKEQAAKAQKKEREQQHRQEAPAAADKKKKMQVGSLSMMTGDMMKVENNPLAGCSSTFTVEETSHPTSSSQPETPTTNTTAPPTLCVHCQSNDRTHIVLPCMHYTLCDECVEQAQRVSTTECYCPTCNATGFLYARVGVLADHELQEKLLQHQVTPIKQAAHTLRALAFQ